MLSSGYLSLDIMYQYMTEKKFSSSFNLVCGVFQGTLPGTMVLKSHVKPIISLFLFLVFISLGCLEFE